MQIVPYCFENRILKFESQWCNCLKTANKARAPNSPCAYNFCQLFLLINWKLSQSQLTYMFCDTSYTQPEPITNVRDGDLLQERGAREGCASLFGSCACIPWNCDNTIISFPDLLWTRPKARSGQIRFALRDHLSGMWQGRQVRMPNINLEQ